jgi:hypothetical protein
MYNSSTDPSAPPPQSMDPRGGLELKQLPPYSATEGGGLGSTKEPVTVSVIPSNFATREQLVSMINNYRTMGKLSQTPLNLDTGGNGMAYLYCLCMGGCLRCYTNTPTQVQLLRNFNGSIAASNAACGYNPSCLRKFLGKFDFQKVTAHQFYKKLGNIHIVYVPEGS